ncbi:MAG: hypothetical protein MUE60_09115 [Candidatus Eisenbacteria bacterium]|jgi:hypothetical protein|nr:hypothetical protein [Candidatus Eisenbacteria bacterium]
MNGEDTNIGAESSTGSIPGRELTPEEEEEVRFRVRERLRAGETETRAREELRHAERQRRSEGERLRWQVVQEETERFHRDRGRVRYVSSTGQVLWLTPEDISLRRSRRLRGRKKGQTGRPGRTGAVVTQIIRTAGVSLVVSFGIVVALAAVIYMAEFA